MTTAPDTTEPRHESAHPHPLTFQTDPDRGPVTAAYAANLIRAVLAERPDWTFHTLAAALDECRDQDIPTLRRAVYAVAEQPGSAPELITRTGPHWGTPDPEPATQPDPQACPRHPYRLRGQCDDDQCTPSTKRGPAFWAEYERAKEAAAAERARLRQALEKDRARLAALGTPEPRHVR